MIPKETFELIKKVPIEQVLHTVKFIGHGNRIMALCPKHSEKQPSFAVYKDTNSFWCFGGCAKGGDVVALIMWISDVSFVEAVEYLKQYI